MPTTHIVAQGEHLTSIAQRYGFENYEIIWSHAKNAALRKKRESPHLLCPGDSVYIPDAAPTVFKRPTGKSHQFVVHVAKLKVRVRLLDPFGDPLANQPCEVNVAGDEQALQTDGDGKVEVMIPPPASDVTITVGDLVFPLKVGHLDPIDTASGVVARISNLGHRYADPAAVDQERIGADFAIMLFMEEQNADPSSVDFDSFLEVIRTAHGV